MSFLDQAKQPPNPRSVIAVAGIHAALAAALFYGFAGPITDLIDKSPFVANQFPTKPAAPPPPPPKSSEPAEPSAATSKVTSPPSKMDLAAENTLDVPVADFTGIEDVVVNPNPGTGTKDIFVAEPVIEPPRTFDPVGVKARNNPETWALTRDYPRRDLREGNEGVVRFQLAIGTDGRVSRCQVLGSSGHASLDAVTCDLVTRRARFDAARGNSGEKVTGTYASSVRWVIPK
ncbi:energy transducer TonB [Altererythrobacter aquiaggeris]|uniref:energy transducer TonB n=1 Tax=Aestuarierythrobacter aquiaggeris TaxID=1898396 RepID=UPI00301AAA01